MQTRTSWLPPSREPFDDFGDASAALPLLSRGVNGPISYFKRFRMEVDLNALPPPPVLPSGYRFVPWERDLQEVHAEILFRSFHAEIDAIVFPSMSTRMGCTHLLSEICRKQGFCPEATWLLLGDQGYVGTVQGVRERSGLGAIQNLGITNGQRGSGLGSALLLQALHGFHRTGLGRSFLEVTAQNEGALRLYRRLGFVRKKTLYKAVEIVPA